MTLKPDQFYLPYQFVPVTGKCNNKDVTLTDIDLIATGQCNDGDAARGARHDIWLKGFNSGRVVCRLTTETPTFVGAGREPGTQPVRVHHAEDAQGNPMIPGSSLRGVVSSIAEAISQSALRVLAQRTLSVRAPTKGGALSAFGRVTTDPESGALRIQPQTLPTLNGIEQSKSNFELPQQWADVFGLKEGDIIDLRRWMPGYLKGYKKDRTGKTVDLVHRSDVSQMLVDSHASNKTYYLECGAGTSRSAEITCVIEKIGNRLALVVKNPSNVKVKTDKYNNTFLLGWHPYDGEVRPLPGDRAQNQAANTEIIAGQVRIIAGANPTRAIPTTKKYESFIPIRDTDIAPLRIMGSARLELTELCRMRFVESEGNFPFVPIGSLSAAERFESNKWLNDGDVVFCDLHPERRDWISHISFSSLWRLKIDQTIESAFDNISPQLSSLRDNRYDITPAEALFGVVRESTPGGEDGEASATPALASRLRFSDALCMPGENIRRDPAITLHALLSPKPPSPAFYFESDTRGAVRKDKSALNVARPKGRKFYLHHPAEQVNAKSYVSHNEDEALADKKSRIAPLSENNEFEFHVDFDNLSDAELHLLLTSLRPSASFRHRIGMGKPLGLGTIRIDIAGVYKIDRHERYASLTLNDSRYKSAWRDGALMIKDHDRYPQEVSFCGKVVEIKQGEHHKARPIAGILVDDDSLAVLRQIGERPSGNSVALDPNVAVCYPRNKKQLEAFIQNNASAGVLSETELYKWNADNDKQRDNKYQYLRPMPKSGKLPALIAREESTKLP